MRQQVVEVGSTFKGFDEPKTSAGQCSIAIPPFLCKILETQLAERSQPGKDGLVFVNTRGNTPHHSSFTSQAWKRAGSVSAGRTFAGTTSGTPSWRIATGAHPKQIQEEAGRSSYNTTMNVYGHLFESLGERVADAMEEIYESCLAAPAPKVTRIA